MINQLPPASKYYLDTTDVFSCTQILEAFENKKNSLNQKIVSAGNSLALKFQKEPLDANLEEISLPFICLLESDRFVVVDKRSKVAFWISDPGPGIRLKISKSAIIGNNNKYGTPRRNEIYTVVAVHGKKLLGTRSSLLWFLF